MCGVTFFHFCSYTGTQELPDAFASTQNESAQTKLQRAQLQRAQQKDPTEIPG